MRNKDTFLLLCLLLLGTFAVAQGRVVEVCGSAQYTLPPNESPEVGRIKALDAARQDAMRKKFGGISTNQIENTRVIVGGESTVDINANLGGNRINGEWVCDKGEPQFTTRTVSHIESDKSEKQEVVIEANVCGLARESKPMEISCHLLRNSIDLRNESSEFLDGDYFYLRFAAPDDGYLMVYLIDPFEQKVYLLPPSPYEKELCFEIKKNKEYVCFKKDGKEKGFYQFSAEKENEQNVMYVIFSQTKLTNTYLKPTEDGNPPSLSVNDFRKWLYNAAKASTLIVKQKNITITGDTWNR